MAKVFVVNKSFHDYSDSVRFGELIPLSEGKMSRYELNNMLRQFSEGMGDSSPSDYIIPCGLSMMNVAACVIFALKHRRLNLLLFKNGRYIEQNLVFE